MQRRTTVNQTRWLVKMFPEYIFVLMLHVENLMYWLERKFLSGEDSFSGLHVLNVKLKPIRSSTTQHIERIFIKTK